MYVYLPNSLQSTLVQGVFRMLLVQCSHHLQIQPISAVRDESWKQTAYTSRFTGFQTHLLINRDAHSSGQSEPHLERDGVKGFWVLGLGFYQQMIEKSIFPLQS